MQRAAWTVGTAAALVLVADLVVVGTSAARPAPDRLATVPAEEVTEDPTPTATTSPPTATPSAIAAPTVEPVLPVVTATPQALAEPETTTAAPAPAPVTAARQFQGLYGPLPTGCLSMGHACAYGDARGPVTGGPLGVKAEGAGPGAVTVTWWPSEARWDPPAVGVVIRIVREWEARNLVVEHRDPRTDGSVTLRDLPAGTTVYAQVQELNSEGLSPGAVTDVLVPAAPPPSPSATGTPSPTPTP